MREAPSHPIAPPSGVLAVARIVLYEKLGPGEHPCHWCGKTLRWIAGGGPGTPGSLLADHLDWNRHNDDPANLVAACQPCNGHRTSRRDRPLLEPDDLTRLWGGKRTRAVRRSCLVCDHPFLTIPAEVKKGKGLYCSRSCARRAPRAA
jgi:hypothetical protein